MSEKGPSKFALGIALLVMGFVFLGRSGEVDLGSSYSNDTEPVKIEGFQKNDRQSKEAPKRIIIPDLEVDLGVSEAKIVGGFWEVFDDKAGWGEGSGIPGQPGNQVIFAHAREGLFLPLRSIKVGMDIYVLTDRSWFDYTVTEIKEVLPSQTEVIEPTENEILTLYTCSGYKDSKRFIVTAKPI